MIRCGVEEEGVGRESYLVGRTGGVECIDLALKDKDLDSRWNVVEAAKQSEENFRFREAWAR